jgi:chitinase
MTTSIVYTTKVYTVTSCAPTVTNCPAKMGQLTTETIVLATTICPVSALTSTSYPSLTTVASIAPKQSTIGTIFPGVSKTTSAGPLQVTAAAGRVSSGLEMMAVAAAGVVVAFL